MMKDVFFRQFSLPVVDINEVLRYMGAKRCTGQTETIATQCIKEYNTASPLVGKVCFCRNDISFWDGGVVDFSFMKIKSYSLSKHLSGCTAAVVFSATIGVLCDRLILKYSKLSQTKALCFEAIGNQQIEALCDIFCTQLQEHYSNYNLTSRFSPGYGDLPLELQKDIFKILDCQRSIGLTLNDSLLMSPSKSVTAIVGLKARK